MKRPIFYISILVAIIVLAIISQFRLIGFRTDNNQKISTITIELVESKGSDDVRLPEDKDKKEHFSKNKIIKWRLIADPPPDEDLVVIIGEEEKPDDWYDYNRQVLIGGVSNRYRTPFYVVIGKSNVHSETCYNLGWFNIFPLYINPLPSVSIVGKGIHIDTDILDQTLPATTYGGHLIPKGHKFLPYRVGNLCGIDKNGKILKRKTRISEK